MRLTVKLIMKNVLKYQQKLPSREMVMPGLLAILVPVTVGLLGGAEMLGGLLAGVTTCGILMAIFQSNAGGAWDNAKK